MSHPYLDNVIFQPSKMKVVFCYSLTTAKAKNEFAMIGIKW